MTPTQYEEDPTLQHTNFGCYLEDLFIYYYSLLLFHVMNCEKHLKLLQTMHRVDYIILGYDISSY